MPSENQDLPKTPTPQGHNCLIPSDLVLSLITLPLLGGLLAAKATAEFVSSIGAAAPVTSSFSLTFPTFMWALTVYSAPTVNTSPVSTSLSNPAAVTLI